ncbi:MAG: hypothetical protein UY05_C0002G0004 [Candidatus Peregrinibacteria bacterium GW2011_GWA2_47_7]|nr:MAG: hypothetical protein UY05_C0002G0004 [Candidatus Peregrinibacteria bacterium GW2011_GWA2_47_7]
MDEEDKKTGDKLPEGAGDELSSARSALAGDVSVMDEPERARVSLSVSDLVATCPPRTGLRVSYEAELPESADDETPLETIADMYAGNLSEALHIDNRERIQYELQRAQENVKCAGQLKADLTKAFALRPKPFEVNTIDPASLHRGIAGLAQFSARLDEIEGKVNGMVTQDGTVVLVELNADDLLKIKDRDVRKIIAEMVQAGFQCGKGPLKIDQIVANVIKHERITNPAAQRRPGVFGEGGYMASPELSWRGSGTREPAQAPAEDIDSLLRTFHVAYFTASARYRNLQFRLDPKNGGMKAYDAYIAQLKSELGKDNPTLITKAPKADQPAVKGEAVDAKTADKDPQGAGIIAQVQELVDTCPPRDGLAVPYRKKGGAIVEDESAPEITRLVEGYESELRSALTITDRERLSYEYEIADSRLTKGFRFEARIRTTLRNYPPTINETSESSVRAGIEALEKVSAEMEGIYGEMKGLVKENGTVVTVDVGPEDLLKIKQRDVKEIVAKMVADGFRCGEGPYGIDTIIDNIITRERLVPPPRRQRSFLEFSNSGFSLPRPSPRSLREDDAKRPPTLQELVATYKGREIAIRDQLLNTVAEDNVTQVLGAYSVYVEELREQLGAATAPAQQSASAR